MKMLKQLIKLHRSLFMASVLFTFLSVILNLCWNKYLAQLLDVLEKAFPCLMIEDEMGIFLATGIFIVLMHAVSEYLSLYLSSYTCESLAHEMRMGYARYYLQSDIQALSKLNVGEEQSAMQNELKDISDYLSENLFSLMRQFGTFVLTVTFLLCQNLKLAMLSIFPVIPLILYCSFSSRIIKDHTQQCLNNRKKINGLADMILELFPIIQILLEMLEKKRQAWQETMNSARYKEECLGGIIKNIQGSRAAQKITEMTEEDRAWLLVKLVCVEDIRAQKVLSEALWL